MAGGFCLAIGAPADATSDKPWSLTPEAVAAWFSTAKPRDQIVYARGGWLVRTAGVEAMSRLGDRGLVILNWRRAAPLCGEWIATKRAEPERPALSAALLARASDAPVDEFYDRFLRYIRRLANMERPCGTNREIAEGAGLSGPDQAAYCFRKAISEGRITVEALTNGTRVVTISASGRKTARAA